jgi:poly(3-hydroxybutyrate) depolymerase
MHVRMMRLGHDPTERPTSEPFLRAARCPFGIDSVRVGSETHPVSESELLTLPWAALTTFSHRGAPHRQILVVAPLSGGFPFLLRDLVIGLLRHAHRVAITDWPDARYVPLAHGRFGVSESISHVASMIRALGPDLHVVAVSQGAVTALAAVALLAAEDQALTPRSLVLLGGPIDPGANPTPLVNFVRARSLRWFEDNVIETVPAGYPGRGRRVFPRSNQLKMFQAYSWRSFHESSEFVWKLMYDDGEDPVRFPFSLLSSSLMDVTADFFLENIQHVFLEPALPNGTLAVHGTRVDLSAIEQTALMTMEAEKDDIAAPGQTQIAQALCSSLSDRQRRHLLLPSSGHFSLFHGDAWRSRVLPAIVDFMEQAGGQPTKV